MDLETLKQSSLAYWQARRLGISPVLPGLTVILRDEVSDIEGAVYEPVVCLILQGRKQTTIGTQHADVGPGDAILVSHHLPVLSRITIASKQQPYLAIVVTLDLALGRGLWSELADGPPAEAGTRSLAVSRADPKWLAPIGRYLDLADDPLDARVLGPSILREIHYRFLMSPAGGMLRGLFAAESHATRIAGAIQILRREFHRPLAVPELARLSGMSETSFHQHFKAVTGTTPLQYQKDLRLITARTLLCERDQGVSEAAYAVGYESPTHFSRDYRRKFGRPPGKEQPGALRLA
jgi:AraC-like DNA-binding protein